MDLRALLFFDRQQIHADSVIHMSWIAANALTSIALPSSLFIAVQYLNAEMT